MDSGQKGADAETTRADSENERAHSSHDLKRRVGSRKGLKGHGSLCHNMA